MNTNPIFYKQLGILLLTLQQSRHLTRIKEKFLIIVACL